MFSLGRRERSSVNIWPAFVDVLATLLLVLVFLLLMFAITQFYLSDALFGRNRALEELRAQVAELAETLSLERAEASRLQQQVQSLSSRLEATIGARDRVSRLLQTSQQEAESLREELAAAEERIQVGERTLELRLKELASLQADIDALREVRRKLEAQVGTLSEQLEASRAEAGELRDRSQSLRAELEDARERTLLAQEEIQEREMRIRDLVAEVEKRSAALSEQRRLTDDATARIADLRQQIQALRQQITSLSAALELKEQTVTEQRTRIEDLGARLNLALARKVEELSRYRSEFFGRLREVLGGLEDIRVVGDRFMFQSELFFASGSAEIGGDGRQKLARVAEVLEEVSERIPEGIEWVLMVEGHTDRRPISTERFPSNWELSTARATAIVHYLIDRGIDPRNLAAAGFGEYHPLEPGNTPAAYARNRRIELRLTTP